MTIEQEKEKLANYIHEFAFEWGKLWNTELTHEQKLERIAEKLKLPEELVEEMFERLGFNNKGCEGFEYYEVGGKKYKVRDCENCNKKAPN